MNRRCAWAAVLLMLAVSVSGIWAQQTAPAIDYNRARGLYQRQQSGERLTPEEQTYLDRARASRGQAQGRSGPANVPSPPPPREFTGLVPLPDIKGDAKYKGFDGGFYGHGSNEVPAALATRAASAAKQIQPLDAAGKPAVGGKIVLMSMGMSNTTQEFSLFKTKADRDPAKNPRVLIVDCAQGGMDAAAWVNEPRNTAVWDRAGMILRNAGASDHQVQAIWLKQALMGPGGIGELPKHTDVLTEDVDKAITLATQRFPNLQLVFLSSRIYAGYATTPLNPEPYAYEGAFAMREVIVNRAGNAQGPVVLWGPYLWADGTKGRSQDKLVWKPEDFGPDGTHPSEQGRDKVASLLVDFFKSNVYAKDWFVEGK